MIITTTHSVEGRPVMAHVGLVVGEAIIGANIFRDLFAQVRDVIGGRSEAYEKSIREARDIAIREMTEEAERLNANAILGVDIDYEVLGEGGSMMMVCASGTAVVINE